MESTQFTPVTPVRAPAPYVGGKRYLSKRLVALIETTPHHTYAEPFVSMGGVFLRRTQRPRAEVINDWSREVSNLFRILQVHYVPFVEMLRFQITTRAEFERLTAVDPETLTDLQRAARFLYLQRTTFGGKVVGRSFGVDRRGAATFDMTKIAPLLDDLHTRLAGVTIERLPFERFIPRYDSPATLFYVDPPYWGSEDYYGAELFSRSDFERLRDVLAALAGRFILSINDRPEMRALFGGFNMQSALTTYGLQQGGKDAAELIVTNW